MDLFEQVLLQPLPHRGLYKPVKTVNVFCFLCKIIKDKIRQARTAKLYLRKNMNYKKDLFIVSIKCGFESRSTSCYNKSL